MYCDQLIAGWMLLKARLPPVLPDYLEDTQDLETSISAWLKTWPHGLPNL